MNFDGLSNSSLESVVFPANDPGGRVNKILLDIYVYLSSSKNVSTNFIANCCSSVAFLKVVSFCLQLQGTP